MEPDPQNPDQFEAVSKLLALKRHEEPPPGYFDRLPGDIRACIAHAAAHPEPFWRRWLGNLDLSPALATGYATAAIALGLGAVWFAQSPARPGNQPLATTPPPVATTNQADLVNPSHTSPKIGRAHV